MSAVTLDQLRTRARQHADLVSSSFISQTELDGWINDSGGELWDLLQTRYEHWVTTPDWTQFTLAGSTYTYALPSDCVKLAGIDVQNGSDWVPMRNTTLSERTKWRTDSPAFVASSPFALDKAYMQLNRSIVVEPETNAAGTYRFRYVKAWTQMSSSSQSIDLPNGWEEYIPVDVAIKCKQKGDRDAAMLTIAKASLLSRIQAAASNRDTVEQDFISDPNDELMWW